MTHSIARTKNDYYDCITRQVGHAADLTRTLNPLLDWLNSLPRNSIVTEDMMDIRNCLGATFLKARGISDDVIFSVGRGHVNNQWFDTGKRFELVISMAIGKWHSRPIRCELLIKLVERVHKMTAAQFRSACSHADINVYDDL